MKIEASKNVPGPCEDEEAIALCVIGEEKWKEEERLMLLGYLSDVFPMTMVFSSGPTMFFVCGKDVEMYEEAVEGVGKGLEKWSKQELGDIHTYYIGG